MSPLNSRVWRRYGQLRIYVSADNDPVGWFDPRTGQSQLSNPDRHDEFWAAVRAECQRLLAEGHISEPELPLRPVPLRTGTTWPATHLAHRPAPGPGNCVASIRC